MNFICFIQPTPTKDMGSTMENWVKVLRTGIITTLVSFTFRGSFRVWRRWLGWRVTLILAPHPLQLRPPKGQASFVAPQGPFNMLLFILPGKHSNSIPLSHPLLFLWTPASYASNLIVSKKIAVSTFSGWIRPLHLPSPHIIHALRAHGYDTYHSFCLCNCMIIWLMPFSPNKLQISWGRSFLVHHYLPRSKQIEISR